MQPRIVYMTYGDDAFARARESAVARASEHPPSAGAWTAVLGFQPEDVDTNFCLTHYGIMSQRKGGGYCE
jgi:hypothetical protein